jgi:tRNA(Ile2) C34 agmatinyltransferase TiaS
MSAAGMSCPMCGETNAPQGALGHAEQYRCRACGAWYSDSEAVDTAVEIQEQQRVKSPALAAKQARLLAMLRKEARHE